jgi:UDP-glucose 4-epimerase
MVPSSSSSSLITSMTSPKRIFVTGATGFLGGHFVELARSRWKLVCLARKPSTKSLKNVAWVKGDLTKDGSWTKALQNCDTVVHLATHPLLECEKDPEQASRVILEGMRSLIRACEKYRISKLVIASTAEVYGSPKRLPISENNRAQPLSVYGFLKACADLYALEFGKSTGMSVCVLRFFNLYGRAVDGSLPVNVLRLFGERILRGEPIVLHRSYKNSRDFLHVKDAARALCLGVEKRSAVGVINVGSGKEVSLLSAARAISALARKPLEIDFQPKEGRLRRGRADTKKARSLLGFKPKISLKRGLIEILH